MRRSALVLLLIALSAQTWAQTGTIRIVTEPWQPFMGPELPGGGFLPELVTAIFADSGLEVSIEFAPWARALSMATSGAEDGLLGAFRTAERERLFLYPEAFGIVRTRLYARADSEGSIGTLGELEGRAVGVVRGAAHGREFDAAGSFIRIEVEDHETLVRMLLLGRCDVIAGPADVIEYLLRTRFRDEAEGVRATSPVLEENAVYLAFSRAAPGAEKLRRLFDDGLARIVADGTFAELARRHGISW
ncbi:MAG: transporter substrate-binding domain-containing protein [Spirochaetales bacterium]|nr:transporter substrate-binding domain-containing protein [Spirochaetales bacterium]